MSVSAAQDWSATVWRQSQRLGSHSGLAVTAAWQSQRLGSHSGLAVTAAWHHSGLVTMLCCCG
ncbi:MAG: hypothetical protein ACR2OA_00880, partial [Rubripirellula sp.]